MDGSKTSLFFALLLLATLSVISVNNGQIITTPCTSTLISTFTPCLNFITGSTSNGSATTPSQNCCGAFKSLASTNLDCACLLVTANVPIQLPINRTLSLSLPRACNMGGVPLQCKASGTPLPAPGPAVLFGPAPAPIADSPLSQGDSKAVAPAPEVDTSGNLTPASPPLESNAPTSQGIRPVLTLPPPPPPPSAASRSCISAPSILLFFLAGIFVFNMQPLISVFQFVYLF